MELFSQATGAQLLFSVGAVGVVLILAVIVFTIGFKTAEQPQFDKLPLVLDDRKSANKKRKTKEKKSTANGQAVQDSGSKNLESGKKSPLKDKSKEPAERVVKIREKKVKSVEVISEAKQKKKSKQAVVFEKPSDFDEGEWETVPLKSEKKKNKPQDDKKDSPVKEKKKSTETKTEEVAKDIADESADDAQTAEDVNKALQEQVKNLQRILNEAEKRDSVPVVLVDPEPEPEPEVEPEVVEVAEPVAPVAEPKDKRKKKEKKAKTEEVTSTPTKELAAEASEDNPDNGAVLGDSGVAFDELGDVWTEAKAPKKSKKKVRKE